MRTGPSGPDWVPEVGHDWDLHDAMTDPIEEADERPIEYISAFSSGFSDAEIDPIEGPVVISPSSPMGWAEVRLRTRSKEPSTL